MIAREGGDDSAPARQQDVQDQADNVHVAAQGVDLRSIAAHNLLVLVSRQVVILR